MEKYTLGIVPGFLHFIICRIAQVVKLVRAKRIFIAAYNNSACLCTTEIRTQEIFARGRAEGVVLMTGAVAKNVKPQNCSKRK